MTSIWIMILHTAETVVSHDLSLLWGRGTVLRRSPVVFFRFHSWGQTTQVVHIMRRQLSNSSGRVGSLTTVESSWPLLTGLFSSIYIGWLPAIQPHLLIIIMYQLKICSWSWSSSQLMARAHWDFRKTSTLSQCCFVKMIEHWRFQV